MGPVCGVVAAGASTAALSAQQMLAGATDAVRDPSPRVPAAQAVLSQGNVPIYFPEAGCAAEAGGKQLPVTAMEISCAPPRL